MSDKYRALVGLDYPPGKRAEAGDIISDVPEQSVKWLVKQQMIEPADKQPRPPKDGEDK